MTGATVKGVFWVNGKYEVIIRYDPSDLELVEVKELIVNKLKEWYPGFDNAKVGLLTLKTMMDAEITNMQDLSQGGEFTAQLKG
jgi:ABC-type xylose transport system substrate-binding protein